MREFARTQVGGHVEGVRMYVRYPEIEYITLRDFLVHLRARELAHVCTQRRYFLERDDALLVALKERL